MTESNPYAAPTTRVRASREKDGPPLASRGARLVGAIIDGLMPGVLGSVLMFTPMDVDGSMFVVFSGSAAVLMLAFLITQIALLVTRSQTLGKVVMKTRIDRFEGGGRAGPGKTIGMRYFVFTLITFVPIVGFIVALLNPFFIFRQDRRCLHDLVAGTHVVDVSRL